MGAVDFFVFVFLLSAGQKPVISFYPANQETECIVMHDQLLAAHPDAVLVDCTPIYKTERARRAPVRRKKPTTKRR